MSLQSKSVTVTVFFLYHGLSSAPRAADQQVRVDFRLLPATAERDFTRSNRGTARRIFRLVAVIAVPLPEQAVAALWNNSRVAYVEEDRMSITPEPTTSKDISGRQAGAVEKPGSNHQDGCWLINGTIHGEEVADVRSFRLVKEQKWLKSWQKISVQKPRRITIRNNTLQAVLVWVFEGGRFRKDLSTRSVFSNTPRNTEPEITIDLPAISTTLDVTLVPIGAAGASAEVTISRLN